jgi:hypothetical protein
MMRCRWIFVCAYLAVSLASGCGPDDSEPAKPADARIKALEDTHKAGVITDAEYQQKLAALKTPSDKPAPAKKEYVAASEPPKTKGRMYRHVAGFSFWYPDDWTVKVQNAFLQLVPEDARSTADGPTELYLLTGQSVAGENITKPEDSRVVAYLERELRSLSPTFVRSGTMSRVTMSQGSGIALDWTAKSPKNDELLARSYVAIIRDHGVALTALGIKAQIAERDAVLRKIFASFGIGEGQRDQKLVGTWKLTSEYGLTNTSPFETDYSRAKLVSATTSTISFAADGTWVRRDQNHMIAGSGGLWIEDKSEKVNRGKWNAGNAELYLIWKDDSWSDYKYRIQATPQGRRMRLESGKTGEIWSAQ